MNTSDCKRYLCTQPLTVTNCSLHNGRIDEIVDSHYSTKGLGITALVPSNWKRLRKYVVGGKFDLEERGTSYKPGAIVREFELKTASEGEQVYALYEVNGQIIGVDYVGD